MKYYLFRDLDNESNLKDGLTFHAYGIVDTVNSEIPLSSGKDLVVTFFNCFELYTETSYRSYSEVELFEVCFEKWNNLYEVLKNIDKPILFYKNSK